MEKNAATAYALEIASALAARKRREFARSFFHLERAHILGQRRTFKHVYAHWLMLSLGFRQGDLREVLGQLPRMLAALLSSRIWVPLGNTGRARVNAFRRMPVPDDLRSLVSPHDVAS
jgi:hypothetical protein